MAESDNDAYKLIFEDESLIRPKPDIFIGLMLWGSILWIVFNIWIGVDEFTIENMKFTAMMISPTPITIAFSLLLMRRSNNRDSILRTFSINQNSKQLRVVYTKYDGTTTRNYDLHKLKKFHRSRQFSDVYYLRLEFEEQDLSVIHIKENLCDLLQGEIRKLLREDCAHQIDFENASEIDVLSSKS